VVTGRAMKLLYIANARIPTEKAHGIQIMKMCEALQQQGVEVELLLPFRVQYPQMKQVQDVWAHYDVNTRFRITRVLTPDFIRIGKRLPPCIRTVLYLIQSCIFSVVAVMLTLCQPNDVYYSRALHVTLLLCVTKGVHRRPVYFEAHELHGSVEKAGMRARMAAAMMRWLLRRLDGLIVITQRLKTLYQRMGMNAERIVVAPDGVDRRRLSQVSDKTAARRKLHISLDKNVICYTGHLFRWKGVYTLAECTPYLPQGCCVYIVGGVESDRRAVQQFIEEQHLPNITLTGYIPYHAVSRYVDAADVVVLPNSGQARISSEYTSPMKLFEYMAAQRPIVASDLPSLREILRHKDNAYLVPPDNPKALAEGILAVLHEAALAEKMTTAAYRDVQQYTWDRRVKTILTLLTAA